jgi:hypothetical protein
MERDELLNTVARLEALVGSLELKAADSNQTIINVTASSAVHEAHAISQSGLIDQLTNQKADLSNINDKLNAEAAANTKSLRRANRALEAVNHYNQLSILKKLMLIIKNTPISF